MKKRKSKQIQELIRSVLSKIGMGGTEAENLVFGTGLIESNFDYLKQWNGGVARSWFQVEPTTALDIIKNYLDYRPQLLEKCARAAIVPKHFFETGISEEDMQFLLESNIAYAIIMCRLKYRRVPKKLPKTIEQMSQYWKQYYNTSLGKGNAQEFADKMRQNWDSSIL